MKKFLLAALVTLTVGSLSAQADPGHGTTGQGGSDTGARASHCGSAAIGAGGSNGSTPMASAGGSNGRSFLGGNSNGTNGAEATPY